MDDKLNYFMRDVGGCGMFQVLACAFAFILNFAGAWGMLFMSFGNFDPGWTCMNGQGNKSSLLSAKSDVATTVLSAVMSNVTSVNTNTSAVDKCTVAASCSNMTFDPESSTVVTEWALICDRSWLGSLIISIQMAGVMVGSFVSGPIGERFGRKKNMYSWDLLLCISNIIAIFSTSWQMYAAIRFFIGIAIGGLLSSCQIYPLEFSSGKWRAFIAGFPNWNLGCVTFGFCVLILKDWKNVHIASAALCGLALVPIFWVPENLRWLAVHGRKDEARSVALKMCRYNRKPVPPDDVIDFAECEGRRADKRPSVVHLFRSSLRKKTLLCCAIFFFMSIMYYAIGFGIGSLFGDFYLNFILYTAIMLPAFPLVPILGNKLGRRWGAASLLFVAFIASISVVIVTFTVEDESQGTIVTALTLATAMFVGLSWDLILSFVVELFPTSVRSMAFAFSYTAARFGGVLAPYVFPRDMAAMFVSFLIMAGLSLVCIAMLLALPETNNLGLDDIMSVKSAHHREVKGKKSMDDMCLDPFTGSKLSRDG